MNRSHEADVLTTYRYLRLATIPLLLMLLISVAIESLRLEPNCLLGSISAYYFTPARGAFVGGLCAVGVCLIVYKGNDPLEDVLLNFSGFMAFVVALVPTVPDGSCATPTATQADPFITDAVRNNVWTLLIAAILGVLARWVILTRDRKRGTVPPPGPRSAEAPVRTWARWAMRICLVVLFVELGLFLGAPSVFQDISHSVAAITMVLGVIGVMVANAADLARAETDNPAPAPGKWVNRYGVVALVMTVLLIATVVAHLVLKDEFNHLILVLEVVVIVNFLVFWGMQTAELWDYPTREDKVVAESGAATKPADVTTDAPSPSRSV